MKFARVIPLLRTPLGIEGFDYRVPADAALQKGDVVRIPFRGRSLPGLVADIFTSSPYGDRALLIEGPWQHLRFPSVFIDLLAWTAERTFSSQPTVFKSWLRQLPKRIPCPQLLFPPATHVGLESTWSVGSFNLLLQRARDASLRERVLIVTPWIKRAELIQKSLPDCLILHSDLAEGEAFRQWTHFLSKDHGCLVVTKIGAWLAPFSSLVLLDEPEQDDHKQDELAPRYDGRKILLWSAQHRLTKVESFGLTPPLHSLADAPSLTGKFEILIHHPQGRSSIPFLQAQALQRLLDHEGPRVVIHPIPGSLARITCRDCQWQATCEKCASGLSADAKGALCRRCRTRFPLPLHCPHCQGVDLSRSLPGIERIQRSWTTLYPNTAIEWRTLSSDHLEHPFPEDCLVLLTDASLLGAGEDIRRRERQCIAVRRLADRVDQAHGTLLLQCREEFAPWLQQWFTEEGMRQFAETERQERRLFHYPPTKRVVKIIVKGDETSAEQWKSWADSGLRKSSLKDWDWRGPFPVEHQPSTRGKRTILHLVLPPETPEPYLIACLRPLVRASVLIDLDPVAFLR